MKRMRAVRGKCSYQNDWEKVFPWVKAVANDVYTAECTLCSKTFNIDSMGRAALASHAKGSKHMSKESNLSKTAPLDLWVRSVPLRNLSCESQNTGAIASSSVIMSSSTAISVANKPSLSTTTTFDTSSSDPALFSKPTSKRISLLFERDETTKAEIIWALQSVMAHNSIRGAASCTPLFPLMFPDSEIARSLKLKKDKLSYMIVYGLSPYFDGMIKSIIRSADFFVLGFDESFNKISNKQQMDMGIRLWDSKENRVKVRYLTSIFLQKSCGEDLLKGITSQFKDEDMKKIVQLSMDGPNVNFKVKRLLNEELSSHPGSPQLLDIGTCGLHTVHNALKIGIRETGWNLIPFFRSVSNLFKQAPGRRGEYTKLTGSAVFPLSVCSVRWVENSKVARRVREMLPHLKLYCKTVNGTKEEPACASFAVVNQHLQDMLLLAKIAFFESLCDHLEPFLTEFQSDQPLAPFLYDRLKLIMKTLLEKIVKEEVMERKPLHKIDVSSKDANGLFINLKPAKSIDLGYGTRAALSKCPVRLDSVVLNFRNSCRLAVQKIVVKLMEKSPLKYPLTKALTCLNPHQIAKGGTEKRLKTCLDILLQANIFHPSDCEKADREYKQLVSSPLAVERLKSYSLSEDRLDDFWFKLIGNDKEYVSLIKIVKLLLTLSHGNANVERGFSVNKEMLVENLYDSSLVAQRIIYDAVSDAGGIPNIEITKGLLHAVRNSHSRYREALEENKAAKKNENETVERKKKAEKEVKELEEKKRKLLEEALRIDEQAKEIKKTKLC